MKIKSQKLNARFILAIVMLVFTIQLFSATGDLYKPYLHDPVVPKHPELSLQGQYQTALWQGAATYNYPIEVPPGRNSLQPALSINYNSHSVNSRPGIIGTGWILSENYIFRDVTYSFKNTSDDKFKLFLDGQIYNLAYNSSEGRYHTEIESSLYIKNVSGGNNTNGQYWIVKSPDGTTYRFGFNSDSELVSNLHPYSVKWSLDLINDTYNNPVYYSYLENPYVNDSGAAYLFKIEYNNEKSRVIEFALEGSDRPDKWLVYEQGNKIRESRRIKEILVKANGNLVKRYVLNYSLIDTSSKSFLSSLTIYGSDNTTILPSTKFEYYNISKGWLEDEQFVTPITIGYLGTDSGVRLADLNRDGLMDLSENAGELNPANSSWINNGSGWVRNDSWDTPEHFVDDLSGPDQNDDTGTRFIDFNGDGFADLVKGDGSTRKSYINTKNGWSADNSTWHLPTNANPIISSSLIFERGVRFADVNGDGLIDILSATDDWNYAWINNGNGWSSDNSWIVPSAARFVVYPSGLDEGVRIEDINGDNLPDLVKGKINDRRTWLNNGSGWQEDTLWTIPANAYFVNASGIDEGIRFMDVNGDGLTDLIKAKQGNGTGWINNGSGWVEDPAWEVPERINFVYVDGKNQGVVISDVNGDGLPDLVNGGWTDTKITFLNKASKSYLLKNVTNNLGGSTFINYLKSTGINNSGNDGVSDLGFNLWLVDTASNNNGLVSAQEIIDKNYYSYNGGFYDYVKKEFRGFSYVSENKANLSRINHWFYQDNYLKGKEYQTEILDISAKPFQKALFNWSLTKNFGGYFVIQLLNEANYLYDGSNDLPKVTEVQYAYDDYGNIKTIKDFGDNETQNDDRYTYIDYVYNTTNWIVNTPKNYTIYNYDNITKVKETLYGYDGLAYGQSPVKGSLTSKEEWLNGGQNQITNYSYNSFGNIVNETDANGHVTQYAYGLRDTTNTFVDRIINAKNHIYDLNYDLGTGNLLWEKDANGIFTNYTYDVLGRITKKILPYDSEIYPTTQYEYETDGITPEKIRVMQRESNNTNTTYDEYYFYDGFGNVIQYKQESENTTQLIIDNYYDSFNRLINESNPYVVNFSEDYNNPNQSIGVTTYEYDPLSRNTKIKNSDNSSKTINFNHWIVTVYDENNNTKTYDFNARGQIIKLTDYLDNNYFITTYNYDANENLILIKNAFGKVINYSYDGLNRKIKETNSDAGTWEYGYDLVGNLIWQKDNRGTNLSLTYDELNRLTSKSLPDETINYSYDQTNGTLQSISKIGLAINFTHDKRLRIIKENLVINNNEFVKIFGYNSMDNLISETMPDNSVTFYNYSNRAVINGISNVINGVSYNTFSSPTIIPYYNSLNTIKSYDLNNNRVNQIKTGSNQDFLYQYDSFGNIIKLEDKGSIFNHTIVYDDLYRIKSSNKSSNSQTAFAYNYTYDFLGRIIKIEDLKNNITRNYYYGSDPLHAPRKITEIGLPEEPTPNILLNLIYPSTNLNVTKNRFFNVTLNVTCKVTDCGEINISLDPEQAETTHTSSSDTTCNGNKCTTILYSGIRNVYEDGAWKKVGDARSLKDQGFEIKYLEKDDNYKLNILDFNYSSVTFELELREGEINKEVPIKLWKLNEEKLSNDQINKNSYKNSYKNYYDTIKNKYLKQDEVREIHTEEIGLDKILEIGGHSTTIILQDANTENLDDSWVSENYPDLNLGADIYLHSGESLTEDRPDIVYIKFNLSSIPQNTNIIDGKLCFYIVQNNYDSNESITTWVYGVNGSWVEENITWNNRPNNGLLIDTNTNYNGDYESAWLCFNTTNTNYENINNISFLWNSTLEYLASGNSYWLAASKEYSNISRRPYLNITYSTPVSPKGLINTTTGAIPFYTNQSNPRTVNLSVNQSQLFTFWVNATGNGTYEFFAFANKTSNPSISNITNKWNVTIFEMNFIDIHNLTQLYSNNTQRTFGFFITNLDNTAMNNVTWKVNTGLANVSSQYNSSLQSGKSKYVIFEYNYTSSGNYTLTATALGEGGVSDSESIGVSI